MPQLGGLSQGYIFNIVLVLLTGAIVTLLVTPLIGMLGRRYGLVDVPRTAKQIHTKPMVRIGGAALYLGFAAAVLVAISLPLERNDLSEPFRVTGLLIGVTIAVLLGLVDDIKPLGPFGQFGGQFAAAAIAIGFQIVIVDLNSPFGTLFTFPQVFGLPVFAVLFTLFWFMGMMNTINWIDGLDGLSAGVSLIAAVVLFLRTVGLPQYSIALLIVALIGTLIGFLRWNFYPAKIFMGSTGAYTLGFALAALSIIGGAKVATALIVLWLPIVDTAWVIFRRLQSGRNPLRGGDVEHLHRRLMLAGLSHRTIVLLYCTLTALLGSIALLDLSRPQKLFLLIGMGMVFGTGMALLAWTTRRKTTVKNEANS